jgi:competence ComEA-like helix-hairpin-helix protein
MEKHHPVAPFDPLFLCPFVLFFAFSITAICHITCSMNRSLATEIAGFLFGLALILAPPSAAASISHPQNEERININTASVEELQRLPSVGPALASRIVEHRRRHGPFKRPQDVVIVRGMGAKLYRRIAHLIRV